MIDGIWSISSFQCYDSFGFPIDCQTLFRPDAEGPIGDNDPLDMEPLKNEACLSFDLYLSKNWLGKSSKDAINMQTSLVRAHVYVISC